MFSTSVRLRLYGDSSSTHHHNPRINSCSFQCSYFDLLRFCNMSSPSDLSTPAPRQGSNRRREVEDLVARATAARAAVGAVGTSGTVSPPSSGGAFETPLSTGSSGAASRAGLAGECIIVYLDVVMWVSSVWVPGGRPSFLGGGRVFRRGMRQFQGGVTSPRILEVMVGDVKEGKGGRVPRGISCYIGKRAWHGMDLVDGQAGMAVADWWSRVPSAGEGVMAAERRVRSYEPGPWLGTVEGKPAVGEREKGDEVVDGMVVVRVEEDGGLLDRSIEMRVDWI